MKTLIVLTVTGLALVACQQQQQQQIDKEAPVKILPLKK